MKRLGGLGLLAILGVALYGCIPPGGGGGSDDGGVGGGQGGAGGGQGGAGGGEVPMCTPDGGECSFDDECCAEVCEFGTCGTDF